MVSLKSELKLPCGVTLKNRLAKAAMSENMGSLDNTSNQKFVRLYDRWARGGAGLLITGNVMVNSQALGEAHNVVFEKCKIDPFVKAWAQAGAQNKTQHWVQLNHPGKQSPKFLSPRPVAPSSIPFHTSIKRFFNEPRALLEKEILEIIEQFAQAAQVAQTAGFTGVQIHGAHGYLVSQFLSPLHNQRSDQWGGSLENRMRFVVSIYQAIRAKVGAGFPVGLKLNSADFQKGGFTQEESMQVATDLSELGVDLIEISGGTYEAPEMTGVRASTRDREAYFIDYCEQIRKHIKTPMMLTGGFRSAKSMNQALASGACDLIGLARALALNPEFPSQLLQDNNVTSEVTRLTSGFKALDKALPLEILWYTEQLHRMGRAQDPKINLSVLGTVLKAFLEVGAHSFKRSRA